MMGQRLELQELLEELLGSDNVYFQPPESIQMKYPCIVYRLSNYYTVFADNNPYKMKKRYQITLIDQNPDNVIKDEIAKLPMCTFDRFFTSGLQNHYVYNIYF